MRLRPVVALLAGVAVAAPLMTIATPATATPTPDPITFGYAKASACAPAPNRDQCGNLEIAGEIRGDELTARGTLSARSTSSKVVRVQIDSVLLLDHSGVVAANRGVAAAPGTRGPANAVLHATVPQLVGICRAFRVEVHESMRLTDGALQHGGYQSSYFVPQSTSCPSKPLYSERYYVGFSDHVRQYSIPSDISYGVSPDGTNVFAYARLRIAHADASKPTNVVRLQIDDVQLLQDGKVVRTADPSDRPQNSGPILSDDGAGLFMASQPVATTGRCGLATRMFFSARSTNGRLSTESVTVAGPTCLRRR